MAWEFMGISSNWAYKGTFEQFKKEFEQTHVFQKVPQKDRLSKMKEAFKKATAEVKE